MPPDNDNVSVKFGGTTDELNSAVDQAKQKIAEVKDPVDELSEKLSRDSRPGQRIGHPFAIEVRGGIVNGSIQGADVGESLMGEVVRFQVAPDQFDVVEFWRVFRKPFQPDFAHARAR